MAGVALLTTLIVYQAYDFALVPILEPQVVRRASPDPLKESDWSSPGQNPLSRYKNVLANYFPANHWSLVGTPKIIENGQMMLVLEDYEPDQRGGVLLKNCAVIAFPTPRKSGSPPPGDAIIIEAPGGAKLQFDEAFNPTRGKIGRLLSGYFPGELVIRSKMTKPGSEDDMFIRTSELRLKESLIYTNEAVEFRFGLHQGSGRQLEIRLLKEEHLKPGETGLEIAGIASLEIRQDVQAQLAMPADMKSFDGGALGGASQDKVAVRSLPNRPGQVSLMAARSEPPPRLLTIQSEGPFRFDFMRFMASFQQNVQATLPRDEGPSDQLLCTELRLHFSNQAGKQAILSPADEPELAKRQGDLLGGLKPFMLEAIGNPLRLDSPATLSALRGKKLQAWIGDQRIRIEGAPAQLANGLNEAQAAWIDYRSPPTDAASPLGDLMMAGPGWLRVTPKEDQPERAIEARWKANADGGPAVVLQRDNTGQPVLEVSGRPEIASSLLGRMVSDSLRIRLREVPADGPDGPAIELGSSDGGDDEGKGIAVLAERIDAIGTVEFRGKELTGRTNSLVVWLRPLDAKESTSGSRLSNRNQNSNTGPAKRNYILSAKQVQLDVGLFGRRAEPTGLLCTGQVRFEESAPTGAATTPLRVIGEQLRVDGLHEEGIRLTVAGQADGQVRATASGGSERPGLAQITGKGMRLWAKELHADQLRNRLWIDGPGDARFDLKSRRMNGLMPTAMNSAMQGEATIRWSGGLEFDGKQIELREEVFAETAEGWLRCNRLAARLSRPIDLSGDSNALGGEVEIAEVECFDGVSIDHRSTDTTGQRSHERVRLSTLKMNQLTGDFSGQGPGWVRSVHLANGDFGGLGGQPARTAQPAPNAQTNAGLKFLRINFQRGISGNLNARALRFHERVRAVYGPVLAWEQELPINSPQGLLPEVAALECDELRVHEDPSARFATSRNTTTAAAERPFGPIELRALGSVRLEGSSGKEKLTKFTAEAASASYTQTKEVFILEGNAQRGVNIWVQQDPTRPPAQSVAGKITYDLRKGQVTKVEDIRSVDYQATPTSPGMTR